VRLFGRGAGVIRSSPALAVSSPGGGAVVKTEALAFDLPQAVYAQVPPEARGLERDQVRLLVSSRRDGTHCHDSFLGLAKYLKPGDLLVVNNSRTIPASLPARIGRFPVRLHLSTDLNDGRWIVEVRVGSPIRYPYVAGEWPLRFYQTLFAKVDGSAEMPSAGRPFTPRVLRFLRQKGVEIAEVTLHTGVSSHELVHPNVEEHGTYPEWYSIPEKTVQAIRAAKEAGRRVIAVGTTVVRALESAANDQGVVVPASGFTELFVHPGYRLRVVDGLLTGFHAPVTSH